MRKFQPSLVDWDEIKQRVLAGEGYTSVAKDYEVSRQAIQKRCNKEEWIANKPRSMAVKRELFKRNPALREKKCYTLVFKMTATLAEPPQYKGSELVSIWKRRSDAR